MLAIRCLLVAGSCAICIAKIPNQVGSVLKTDLLGVGLGVEVFEEEFGLIGGVIGKFI